MFKHKLKTCTF